MLQTPEKFNEIASKSFISKAKFDAGLMSEPLAIMNLLWDYSNSRQKGVFCRKNNLSVLRMQRLFATINNLRDRVASAMGIKVEDLTVKKPPRNMENQTLMIIRFIQVWMFHDCIIYLDIPPTLDEDEDGSLSISLRGDAIEEKHLSTLLDCKRHSFELKSNVNIHYGGGYEPVDIDGLIPEINGNTIEEPILSLLIERDASAVLIFDSDINLYVPIGIDAISKYLTDSKFIYDYTITLTKNRCKTETGRDERDAVAWSIEHGRPLDDDTNSIRFKKFTYGGKKAAKISGFKFVRNTICSKVKSTFALRLNTTNGASRVRHFDLMVEGQDFHITTQDMADIFQTTREKVHLNVVSNIQRQKIIFHPDKMERQSTAPLDTSLPECFRLLSSEMERQSTVPLFTSLPESFRLLSSVASSNYCKKPTLRFTSESKGNTLSADEDQIIETSFKQSRVSDHWKQVSNGCRVIVDSGSVVATAAPSFSTKTSTIFACCPNVLELKNGMMKVEGLTLLPPGKHWLDVALYCVGLHTGVGLLDEDEETFQLAEQFNNTFQCIETESIEYSSCAVKLLNDVLDSMDSYLEGTNKHVKDQGDDQASVQADEFVNVQADEFVNVQADEFVNGQADEFVNGQADELVNGQADAFDDIIKWCASEESRIHTLQETMILLSTLW